MADIVNQLQCIYNPDGCGRCTFCLAKAEIERLRSEVERLISFARLIADAEPYKTLQFDPDDVLWDRVHPTVREAADARAAVAAYEAARKEADRG